METEIPPLVENADDADLPFIEAIKDEVRSNSDSKMTFSDLVASLSRVRVFSDCPKPSLYIGDVTVGPDLAPLSQREGPDFSKIDSRTR